MRAFFTAILLLLGVIVYGIIDLFPSEKLKDWIEHKGIFTESVFSAEKDTTFFEKSQPWDSLYLDAPSEDFKAEAGTLNIVSWNIRHLGRSKTKEEIYEMADLLREYDLVLIQEVVAKDPAGAQAVAKLADELNRMGAQWDYQVSDPTQSPTPYLSERYAFLWKPSKVQMLHRAHLDKELEDLFFREPFIGEFRMKGQDSSFYAVNYHSRKYTDKPEEEIIHFIDYPERFGTDRIILAGDFNLSETHEVWKPLSRKGFSPALHNAPSTLKQKCKEDEYLNHGIDNFYSLPGIAPVAASRLDFVGNCENLIHARGISDHLPILMKFRLHTE